MSLWQWVVLGLIVALVAMMFVVWPALIVSGRENDRWRDE